MINFSYASDGDGIVEVTTNSASELFEHPQYNSIIYINASGIKGFQFKRDLPPNLQVLNCNSCKIFELPPLPSTLRNLYAKNNRISKFPEIYHCPDLEIVDLEDNDIEELNAPLPPGLMTLTLSFNKLRYVNYEYISPITSVNLSYNFLTESYPQGFDKIIADHNNLGAGRRTNNVTATNENFNPLNNKPSQIAKVAVYNDNQNVHNTNIQKTVTESLKYILEYVPKHSQGSNNALLKEILEEYKAWRDKKEEDELPEAVIHPEPIKKSAGFFQRCFNFIFGSKENTFTNPISWPSYLNDGLEKKLSLWWNEQSVHSIFGATYRRLLMQVWAIINDNEFKEEMKKCLFQELEASVSVCFTGRFNRTINALTGFIDEVRVGISDSEEMQNRIVMCIRKCREAHGADEDAYAEDARKQVKDILDEFKIDVDDMVSWLDAI